jgi:hypothetical protein
MAGIYRLVCMGCRGGFPVAKLSVRAAAAQFDISRPTLTKWLKSGKISGEKQSPEDGGGWLIDPAELVRAGVKARSGHKAQPVKFPPNAEDNLTAFDRGLPGNLESELQALKAELALERARRENAERLAEERARHIDDLRRLLPAPDAPAQRKRFWPW